MNKCFFLIPAFNEEKNLKRVLLDFNRFGQTIVINDGSSDHTKNIAKKYAYKIINNSNNMGYDKSLRKGISYVLKNFKDSRLLITVDGDGQHQSKYVKKFLKLSDRNDIIIGNRNVYNRKIEKKISKISKKKFDIIDPLTGFKCYRLDKIRKYWKLLQNNIDYFGMFSLIWSDYLKIKNSKIYVKKSNKKSSMSKNINLEKNFYKSFKNILKQKKISL